MRKETTREVVETTTYHLSTDDLEEILYSHLKLPDRADFDWRVGQWVELVITTKEER